MSKDVILNEDDMVTVASLISQLKGHRQDALVSMGGLRFYRFKDRGPYIQMEFGQMCKQGENEGDIIFYEP